jgi:hypothetical protein
VCIVCVCCVHGYCHEDVGGGAREGREEDAAEMGRTLLSQPILFLSLSSVSRSFFSSLTSLSLSPLFSFSLLALSLSLHVSLSLSLSRSRSSLPLLSLSLSLSLFLSSKLRVRDIDF